MTTEPIFGWPVPSDDDPLADGARAIRDLADAVAATVESVASVDPPDVAVNGVSARVPNGTSVIMAPNAWTTVPMTLEWAKRGEITLTPEGTVVIEKAGIYHVEASISWAPPVAGDVETRRATGIVMDGGTIQRGQDTHSAASGGSRLMTTAASVTQEFDAGAVIEVRGFNGAADDVTLSPTWSAGGEANRLSVWSVNGAVGDTGPQGEIGPQGDLGPQGDPGPQGERGPQGLEGGAFIGEMRFGAWDASPSESDWLFCDGRQFDPAAHPELYALLQTDTTPDMTDRVPMGGGMLLAAGGANERTLAVANLPAHTHPGPSHTHAAGTLAAASGGAHTHTISMTGSVSNLLFPPTGQGSGAIRETASAAIGSAGAHTHTMTGSTAAGGTQATGSTGSGTAVDTTPAHVRLGFIIYAGPPQAL